jgi:hypothetical protein
VADANPKRVLGSPVSKRYRYRCSNPACRIQTIGPEQRGDGTVVVGIAAHITAAAKRGPRYDPSLTPGQRRHQSNGIWLCEIHGKQVDADEQHFTVETLREWKKAAEREAADAITRLQVPRSPKVVSVADTEDVEFGQNLGLPAEDTVEVVTARVALASVALLMPSAGKEALIDSLLQLPGPIAWKQGLLKVLVVAGEIISADMIVGAINELLEEAKTKRWLLDENSGRLDGWLVLLPFSDRPKATLDVIKSLEPGLREPRRLRYVLSALGHAPSRQAEEILAELAQRDARFLAQYEWLNALANRGTLSAGRILLGLIRNDAFAAHGRHDARSLSRELASSIQSHPALRKEVYEQYPALSGGPSKEIVAHAIAEGPDVDGIMLLVREYGAQRRTFRQTVLYEALRHALTGQRPSSHYRGMEEIFGIPLPELRKRLFALIPEGGSLSELAIDCLHAIDDIREHYGEAESEPRHPDITTGRPWPIITDWRKL